MPDEITDYLVVGAGAVGLAFADTLLAETEDAQITIVDRHGRPGGHWNDAYSFVALHQPSAFYGVNSVPLGMGLRDTHGVNAGLHELASGPAVSGYFDTVMGRRLLPSGRVRYLPLTDHLGGGRLRSLLTGEERIVSARRRVVDATYYGTSVPSTHRPRYAVAERVRVVPPNALPHLARDERGPPEHFAIVGAGKTAMDVGVWLLGAGVPAHAITWIMPRDSWLINRRTTQPDMDFFDDVIGGQAAQMEAFAQAASADDLFDRLEAAGIMLRVHGDVRPTMFHYATISTGEIAELATISRVVRMGRVRSISESGLVLDDGDHRMRENTLYVDCTASAVERRVPVPIFQHQRIVCQLVRAPQPAFSAALVAYVEAHGGDDARRNALCGPVPLPDRPEDYPATILANIANETAWARDVNLRAWIRASRLDAFGKIVDAVPAHDTDKRAVLGRIRAAARPAAVNLRSLAG